MTDINMNAVLMVVGTGLFVVVLLAIIYQRHLNKNREGKQKQGLQYLIDLKNVLTQLQIHRGLSTRLLWGESEVAHELNSHKNIIDGYIKSLDEFTHHEFLASRWNAFKEDWCALNAIPNTITAEQNIEQHNHIILVFIYFISDVAEQHDIANTYLKDLNDEDKNWKHVLSTAEWIGQARVLGSGMLNQELYGRVERIRMNFIHSKLRDYADTVSAKDHTMKQLVNFIGLIEKEFLHKEQKGGLTTSSYFQQASRVIEACMHESELEIKQLRSSIH